MALETGGLSPVRTDDLTFLSGKCSLKKSACWRTSGFVGARITALSFWRSERRLTATSKATMVLPSPVGRTTRVLALAADSAMVL